MNAKMDSGSLSYHIRTCFITKTSLILYSRDCSHWFRIISICVVNQLIGFFIVQVFTEGYFGKDWLWIESDNWQIVFCLYVALIITSTKLKQINDKLQLLRQLLKYVNVTITIAG